MRCAVVSSHRRVVQRQLFDTFPPSSLASAPPFLLSLSLSSPPPRYHLVTTRYRLVTTSHRLNAHNAHSLEFRPTTIALACYLFTRTRALILRSSFCYKMASANDSRVGGVQ
jgi:hypothetical protein